jgi:uncharacterized protein YggE
MFRTLNEPIGERCPLGVVLAAGLCFLPIAASAAEAGPRLITITGTGEVRAVPDQAELSAGVITEARTAAAALAENSRRMNSVFEAIKKLGVSDRSIQTSGFNVSPQYPAYNSNEPQRITGYQVTNTVQVKLADLKQTGPALDALVAEGANNINSVGFSIADPAPLLAKARAEAVREATEEAETYARAAGVKLGAVQTIEESGSEPVRPLMEMRAMAPAPTPVAAGEQSVTASVTISWEIQ